MTVDVVIVNWNSGALLRECVASIHAYGHGVIGSIVVVDNASADDSLAGVAEDRRVDLVRLPDNAGFARACNVGAARCRAPYVLFLNPDARLMAGGIDGCVRFLESREGRDVGIVGAQLVDARGEVQRSSARFPTFRTYLGHALLLDRVMPRVFPPHFMREFDHRSSRDVDQVIGAFFLVRRDLFSRLGGFDERFFVYFEEVDFAWRARAAGWRSRFLADVMAYHKGGGTTDRVKAQRLFYSLRSRILYAFKNLDSLSAWGVLLVTLLLEPLSRLGQATLRASFEDAKAVVRAYGFLLRDLPRRLRSAA